MKSITRKILSLLVGVPILIIGIILIPLPGPGILVCLLGLFILSREFDWANSYFEKAKDKLQKVLDKSRERADSIGKKGD